ncbi:MULTISPECIES: MFS transporter [unclassified Brevundimonas]|jgi:multidrug resistance protein|uniref:MFS transporter n=1 Tax=Brevundimonas TaxID=41275 RepID=UPI0006D21FB9|nr:MULTISPECIES: MFS transporter [unclassified Brevundimonas]ALJ07134.1 multidrug transporter [Brevundimonas sp. DS20]MAL56433.1 MFS transporter [Brevundimonas sp.]QFU30331.1 Tetracycline resistance protein, class C [Brevundimonas sp. Bb-A]HAF80186.1 MFS transporter [Brevundimonas sp.]
MTQTTPSPAVRAPALAVLFAVVFINLVGFGLVVPLLPFFAQSLKAEAWQITLMFSAYSLGQFFAEPFWGRLSDRVGRKPVLLVTLVANALGYLMLAFVPNIWLAVAVRLFTGLGAGNISTVQGYVADVTPPEQRAGRMGLIGAAFGLGFIVGPGLGGLLTQPQLGRLGYQLPIFLAAALAALAAVGVMVFLRESRAKADPTAARPAFLAGLKDARTNPVVSRVLVVTLIYMAGFSAMESVFGLWSESRYAWGAREVGLSFMIVGVISVLNQGFLAGRLARRFGEARVLATGMLLFGASLVLQVLAPVEWFPAARLELGGLSLPVVQGWVVPIIMAVGACGMSLAMPNISAMISRASPPDRQGAMLGLNMASSSVARIFGPMVAGGLFSGLGHDWPFLIGALLTVPAAVMALNAGRVIRKVDDGVKAPA